MSTALYVAVLPSPIGALTLVAELEAVKTIWFPGSPDQVDPAWSEGSALLRETARQLEQYFAGRRQTFDLPLDPDGTPFQREVWAELTRIPYGTTTSYAELARRIGRPSAVRAVGAANGANPIPIVIPCHRVIGRDGALTGFGGGLDRKRFLLELEANRLPFDAGTPSR